jgi:hypothetical protein
MGLASEKKTVRDLPNTAGNPIGAFVDNAETVLGGGDVGVVMVGGEGFGRWCE